VRGKNCIETGWRSQSEQNGCVTGALTPLTVGQHPTHSGRSCGDYAPIIRTATADHVAGRYG
jgi:hypothetical protein